MLNKVNTENLAKINYALQKLIKVTQNRQNFQFHCRNIALKGTNLLFRNANLRNINDYNYILFQH